MKRHAWTLYWSAITTCGFSVAIAGMLLMPELSTSGASRQPGPVVTVTVGPSVPAPRASGAPPVSPSPGASAVGAHRAATPRVELVGTTPSVGLPAPSIVSSPGPTVLPTPSATASGSVPPSPSPSSTPSSSPSTAAPGLGVAAVILGVHVTATVGLPALG